MKKFFLVLTIFAIIVVGSIGFNYFAPEKGAKAVNDYRIAIFTPVTHAALQEIEQGFKETLLNDAALHTSFITYNANGNKTLARAQADEIINSKYNLIFSIGSSCTQLIAEIAKKKGTSVPQVFCSIDDPVGMGLVASLNSSKNHITGVIEGAANYKEQLAILATLIPNTKNVLLVYDPAVNFSMERERNAIESILKKNNITLHSVEISHSNEIQQKVTGLLAGNDVVLILKDNTVVSGIDSLITLCNRYGIPLFASDLNSGKKGAVLAYGIEEADSGIRAADIAIEILGLGKQPSEIPIKSIDKQTLALNKETLQKQHLVVDSQTLEVIDQTGALPAHYSKE